MYPMVMVTSNDENVTEVSLPVPQAIPSVEAPAGFIWERFDGFAFASNADNIPLPGQFHSMEDAAAKVLAGGMPRSPRATGSPIPGF